MTIDHFGREGIHFTVLLGISFFVAFFTADAHRQVAPVKPYLRIWLSVIPLCSNL